MTECSACVILDDQDRVLIAQRKKGDSFGGYWEFPGGKRQAGETLEACGIREVREELDVEIAPDFLMKVIRNPYPNMELSLNFFMCHFKSGTPKKRGCDDVRWVRISELKSYRFPPANEPIIEILLKNPSSHTRS